MQYNYGDIEIYTYHQMRDEMITEKEAKELMTKLNGLKAKAKEDGSQEELNKHLQVCMEKFKYLVTVRTGRYKSFANYDDLNQEGFEALLRAMKTYNQKKGSFFSWAHHYIGTRISRAANMHSTIRYPMKIAKDVAPHKEIEIPEMIDEGMNAFDSAEEKETSKAIRDVLKSLTKRKRTVILLAYGFDGDKPMSINKICHKLNINRNKCIDILNDALDKLRDNIKI